MHNRGSFMISGETNRPWIVNYVEQFDTKTEARRRELFFKSIDGYNWLRERGIATPAKPREKTPAEINGELAERLLHQSCPEGIPSGKTGARTSCRIDTMPCAYILRSLKNGRFYYGSTENLNVRVAKHNAGKVRSTKAYRPWVVHYSEQFETKSEAYRRERFFKSIDGYNWLRNRGIIAPAVPGQKSLTEIKEELAERLLHQS
jgi:putative endonuclease